MWQVAREHFVPPPPHTPLHRLQVAVGEVGGGRQFWSCMYGGVFSQHWYLPLQSQGVGVGGGVGGAGVGGAGVGGAGVGEGVGGPGVGFGVGGAVPWQSALVMGGLLPGAPFWHFSVTPAGHGHEN